MGLSASQARFLQLTARKSNVEYQAQQINFQRLQWSDKLAQASSDYQDKTSNMKMVFSFNGGTGIEKVDVTYSNYKNYMNQQLDGVSVSQQKYYLVSSSGQKIIVANEEERQAMWKQNLKVYEEDETENQTETTTQEQGDETTTSAVATTPTTTASKNKEEISSDDIFMVDGVKMYQSHPFKLSDFMIVEDLDNVDLFQDAIQNGDYYFAILGKNSETDADEMQTQGWETLGAGAISEVYDTTDDAAAEAEFKATEDKIQLIDKKLELQLEKLETERNAIQTEIDSVSQVIEDNVESSFKVFS